MTKPPNIYLLGQALASGMDPDLIPARDIIPGATKELQLLEEGAQMKQRHRTSVRPWKEQKALDKARKKAAREAKKRQA